MAEGSEPSTSSPPRRRRGLAVVVGVAVAAGALLALVAGRRGGELELEVSLPRERFLQGEPILMSFVVRNVSPQGVEVDRFEPFEPEACIPFSGRPVDLRLYYERLDRPILHAAPEPGGEGRGRLGPGETLRFRCNVAELFGIVKPGDYVLRVSYVRDRWAQKPSLAPVARLLGSVVSHDDVPFEVVRRIYDEKNQQLTEEGAKVLD